VLGSPSARTSDLLETAVKGADDKRPEPVCAVTNAASAVLGKLMV